MYKTLELYDVYDTSYALTNKNCKKKHVTSTNDTLIEQFMHMMHLKNCTYMMLLLNLKLVNLSSLLNDS